MKKFLLALPALAMLVGMGACNRQREWTHEQRKEMRESLRDYRRMAYLNDLTEEEYVVFSDDVAGNLETDYPVYATFISMPGVDDTVRMVVITTVVEELDADARNMRHLYPYDYLLSEGVLPAGLDREQQRAFYNCFAGKVNSRYSTMRQFYNAVLSDTTDRSEIARMQQSCAADLFDWTYTVTEIVEED